ncbi:Peroxisomal membrane PMP22 isoform A [Micractinium conductrix]|uniref:Peroxisomal membrane PMP22 isoform A n=1 Tax=Micractinium conductrix TaxID=554055 RepID=A0A2P6V4W2_9CHLO|nr:Peroxisomal membrane PMP22 isoform B [Micractinium conductrix]PSC69131.1 Peroxisomal membrane PMP22 isoform A [Micractinium conductrix]|eukprot:PSC69130.1 Peroxisomal membrane PMP22 isoform B [Micractinium conductrix]
MSGGVLELAWRRYTTQLERRPLVTKSVTAGTMAGLSDLLAQRLTASAGSTFNWRRTLAIALYGGLWAGPASHYWQAFLEKLFPNKKDPLRSLKKVAVDQLTFGPFVNALFMSYMSAVVEGRSLAATRAKVSHEFTAVQARSWRVWPLASFVSQQYVPLQLRVLWLNCVAFLWSTFLILRSSGVASRPALLAAAVKLKRCLLLACFGLVWYGPSNHAWQAVLTRLFPPPATRSALHATWRLLQRVGLDQLVYAPVNNCLMIFYVALVADQRGFAAARAKAVAELPGVQARGWRVWPLIQLVNQSLIPLELRVLCNNACAVAWTSFVILRAQRGAALRKLPVYSLSTWQLTDKAS